MRKLILMRGIPGGGKSTLAKELASTHINSGGQSVVICSTDSFFINIDGDYVFDADYLAEFHTRNQLRAHEYMKLKTELVIIDNTNVRRRDMEPYRVSAEMFGYEVREVIVGKDDLLPSLEDADPHKFADYIDMCAKRNTHGVPRDAIEKMARRFQE